MSLLDAMTITFCIIVFFIQIMFLISTTHREDMEKSINDIEEEYRKTVQIRSEREKREKARNYEVR